MVFKGSRRKIYRFREARQSREAWIGVGLGCGSAVALLVELVRTIMTKGDVSTLIGFIGIISFAFSATGLYFSSVSWKDEDATDMPKRMGTIANILLVLMNIAIFIMGII